DAGGDHLDVALKQLRLAVDVHEVAVVEASIVVLAGVPHAGVDRARAVAQLDLQVEVAVAVRAQLLFGGEEDLLHLLVVGELADETARVGGHGRRLLALVCRLKVGTRRALCGQESEASRVVSTPAAAADKAFYQLLALNLYWANRSQECLR